MGDLRYFPRTSCVPSSNHDVQIDVFSIDSTVNGHVCLLLINDFSQDQVNLNL
jgi:hypothetical protein